MDTRTAIRSLPVSPPPPGIEQTSHEAKREDGSYDFTPFFASLDTNSKLAQYLSNFDASKFLELLRAAASPLPAKPKLSQHKRRVSEPSQSAIDSYQAELDARERAKAYLCSEIEALDSAITQMEVANVPGVEALRKDFIGAKQFMLDAVANCNTKALTLHLEFDSTPSTPGMPTPPSPRLGTVPLPEVTPTGTPEISRVNTPFSPAQNWPSMLMGPNGVVYRVVATPCELTDSSSYFQLRESSPSSVPSPVSALLRRPAPPVFGRRPTATLLRSLSGLRKTSPNQ
ncbi:SubName: Full=Uncharacterized protein {ECO:0000313/EMBL:CCA73026.1} [Serendipita indica DSM 11827]|uniref:Uncharacterized protein n=1 Tax=Serendipita indica (strain DSM 11827) TaxID=1109443 RepID=G4TNY0_SERID|nr:SubName: Full=Uncharacterized protein {ECO:0000313/EMBL:CCA73026.1} [Serendipita indica DSM 11827]CCA73026.1 hypothetical protein PIIN_06981 [Serendipita indica DSM 11827]